MRETNKINEEPEGLKIPSSRKHASKVQFLGNSSQLMSYIERTGENKNHKV